MLMKRISLKWVACSDFFSNMPPIWIQKRASHDFCINAYCISGDDFLFLGNKFKGDSYPDDFLCRPHLKFFDRKTTGFH